jgi:hypothetical protein
MILLSIKFVISWFVVINIYEVRNCHGSNLGVWQTFRMDYIKVSLSISEEVQGFHVGIKLSTKGQNL